MTIKGLGRLKRKLDRFPKLAEARVKAAMEKGANEVVALMKHLAPSDSGDLRESIGWTWGEAPKGAMTIGEIASSDGKLSLKIYAGDEKTFYARFVEFGTAAHKAGGKFEGATIPAIPAQPFFFVSWRAMKKRTVSRISRAVRMAAKEIAAKG
ncbi:phage protein, HK97 gp10 family [Roseibium sp. TrichSKD4]|uniref:HK97-gp10 family putative phage morphogenesis protein n=1 Tax=Roseibium sp. TrichSKD4 TaxID=744980 RepID=UPI0001E56B8B|nr:HK97-gp10 family putative phage morphogenesis protein [Roseibium sp. TrichSKD4]EFO32616.1 phage protein, HK97 gp10 family [Roseibium sp. TrichSKD4]